ncbi:hypothetical protein SAMN04487761_10537 [Lachnospiraceae bacterium C7]|nr:hypothetical protein SAMN04487761_10537 [Lachnospiraceae bacterium C7]
MNWMNKLERKIQNVAIPNITMYLVICCIAGNLFSRSSSLFMKFVVFDMHSILHGQIWRLVSWILVPGGSFSILNIIFLLFLIPMGRSIENMIGTAKLNIFLIGGLLLSLVLGIVQYFVTLLIFGVGIGPRLTIYYVLISIFMLLGIFMPDATALAMFIIPIKMKYMLIIYIISLVAEMVSYVQAGILYGLLGATPILFSLINLVIFYLGLKYPNSFKQARRSRQFRKTAERQGFKVVRPGQTATRHKCAICGRTELDDPNLTFRYCSKCNGSYEYCNEHLYTHEHVK